MRRPAAKIRRGISLVEYLYKTLPRARRRKVSGLLQIDTAKTPEAAQRQRPSTGLLRQRKHAWWRRTDRLTSVPSTPNARLQFWACGGARTRLWHRIRRSMVEIPGHRSTERCGGEPSADADCPSPRSPHAVDDASLDELRCEWRRLYRSEPARISRDLLIRGVRLPAPRNPTWRARQIYAAQAEDSREDVPDRRPNCS